MTIEGDGDMYLTEFSSFLHIFDEKDKSILKLDFIDCVLQSIGDIEFDTTGDDQELTLTLTIDYAFFTFNKEEKTKKHYDRLLRNTIVSENQDKFKEE